jgi:ABC-type uncharacterized transport system permease subunit
LVALVWWLLFRTRFGLRLRAVGENPAMVDAAGVSVSGVRYLALIGNGALCGLAGCYLVLAQNAAFAPHMTAGRGFMALAAMIFGKWHPVGALWACLLFGFRRRIDPPARHQAPRFGRDPGATDSSAALFAHRSFAGGFHWQSYRAESAGFTVYQDPVNAS